MLPLKNRIKKRKDFERVFQKGKSFFGSFFILKTYENDYSFPRFAFVFPVKYEKKAHKRNRGKRIFREVVRIIDFKKNRDIIFILKKDAEKKPYKEVKKEVEKILKKLK